MKRNSIIVGSIFVLALILLMPSIPAIQQKTIVDKAYDDFVAELNELGFENIRVLDDVKLPILYAFVMFIFYHRYERCNKFLEISVEFYGTYGIDVKHPILFIYSLWLFLRFFTWYYFWFATSYRLGLDWGFD